MAKAAPTEDWPQTVAEFQDWHARQPERWEFIDEVPRLMAPGSLDHTIIKTNLGFALRQGLMDLGCTVLIDGAQILTEDISAIPDVLVTCAELDHATTVVSEPKIIVEVLSPKSEADDTGRKWFAYRKSPSLAHYLVVAQEQREVLLHTRVGDLWHERFFTTGPIQLQDPSIRLELEGLYAGTAVAA